MSAVGTILHAKLRIAGHSIGSVRNESKLKIAVIAFSALLLWVGAFVLFHEGMNALLRFGQDLTGSGRALGSILMARMLSILLLTLFFMLIFSNILVAFSTLYRSREVTYLIQAPMTFRAFFVARFFECVAFSSWALAFLGSPLLLAFGLTNKAPVGFYAACAAYFLPFVTLPAAIGAMITLLLARVFPILRVRVMVVLAIASVLLLFAFGRQYLSANKLSEDTILPALLDITSQTQSPFLPSYWASKGLLAMAAGDAGECVFNFLLLAANALMGVWLAAQLAQAIFHRGWSSLAGMDRNRLKPYGRGPLGRLEHALRHLPNPARALVVKDIKLFWRDPTQWSQFVIFFGIMAVYIANLRNTSRYYEQEFWRSWIACLNIGACTLILATLTSRFVFPLVSLEGRRFWIIGLAPLQFQNLVWQKFWLSVTTTCAFTVGLAALSGYMLKLEPVYYALTVYSVFITNFGLSGLAVGLGSLYPNFQEDNPARIVSGMGGTLNFLLSVAYITLIVGAQTFMLQWRVLKLFRSETAFYTALVVVVVFVTVLSLGCMLIPMRLGLRNLRQMEF